MQDNNIIRDAINCLERLQKENAELKAENERLKRENNIITGIYNSASNRFDKIYQTLQEIKAIVTEPCIDSENCLTCKSNCMNKDILDLITKAESEG